MPNKMDRIDILDSSNTAIKDSDLTYDNRFKQLFYNKKFLTPILKNIIPEYKYCSLEVIEGLINPYGDQEVNPAVYSSEDAGKGNETLTRYDVLIDCSLPDKKEKACVDLFFDLEMQRESEPEYPISKRGVYYCCRLISRQIETLGKESYNQLRPIYSVWILVNNIPQALRNSVYTAGMSGSFNDAKKNVTEDTVKISKQIDLIHLCLIYLSENFKIEEGQSDLVKYLQSVFARKIDDKNCNPYCEYSSEIKKEVDEVMSFRESFEKIGEQRGVKIGEQRGVKIGEQRGVIKMLLKFGKTDTEVIQYLMEDSDNPLTREQAMNALKNYREINR